MIKKGAILDILDMKSPNCGEDEGVKSVVIVLLLLGSACKAIIEQLKKVTTCIWLSRTLLQIIAQSAKFA